MESRSPLPLGCQNLSSADDGKMPGPIGVGFAGLAKRFQTRPMAARDWGSTTPLHHAFAPAENQPIKSVDRIRQEPLSNVVGTGEIPA